MSGNTKPIPPSHVEWLLEVTDKTRGLILTTTLRLDLHWPPDFTKPVASPDQRSCSPQKRDPSTPAPVVFQNIPQAENLAATHSRVPNTRPVRAGTTINSVLNKLQAEDSAATQSCVPNTHPEWPGTTISSVPNNPQAENLAATQSRVPNTHSDRTGITIHSMLNKDSDSEGGPGEGRRKRRRFPQ